MSTTTIECVTSAVKLEPTFAAIIDKTIKCIGNESNIIEVPLSTEVSQYKDIIRKQDTKLQTALAELRTAHDEADALRKQLTDVQQSNSQLFDQNILLKAQLTAATSTTATTSPAEQHAFRQSTQIGFYEAENARLVREVADLNRKLNDMSFAAAANQATRDGNDVAVMRKEQEELLELLSDQVKSDSSAVRHCPQIQCCSRCSTGSANPEISSAVSFTGTSMQRRRRRLNNECFENICARIIYTYNKFAVSNVL